MTIRLLDGLPLLVGGAVALSDACCCTPSCLPNICVSPGVNNCKYCWNPTCEQCLEWLTIEVAVDGVEEAELPTAWIPPGCSYGFDCHCDLFNSSYIHDFSNGCASSWWVREASPPFLLFDTCGTPQSLACNAWQIRRDVYVRVAVANQQVSYTAGVASSITFPNMMTLSAGWPNQFYICQNYTLVPGHYVLVILQSQSGVAGFPNYVNTKYFIYPFANGAKVDPDCAEDQYYPHCGPYIGGDAVLLASSRYERSGPPSPPTYYADCDDFLYTCKLKNAIVTVEPPDVTLCEVIGPPPP